ITLITEMMLVCDYSETALNQPLQFTYLTMDCHASVVEFNALKASLTNPGLFFRFFIGQPPVIRSLTHGGSSLSKHKLRLETDPKGKVLGFSGQLVVQNTEPTPTINQPRTLSNGHTVNIEHVYPVGVDIMAERVNQMLFLNGQQYAYHSSSKTPCEWSVAFFNLYPTLKFIVVAHKKDLSPNANPRGEQTKTLGPKIVGSLSDFNLFLLPEISSAQKLLENAILSGEGFQNRAVNQPHSGNEPRFKYRIIETRMTEAEFNQLNTSVTNSSQFFTALDDCRGNTHPNSCQIFYEKITPQPPEHRHIPSRPSLRPGPSPHPHSE
ncbi:MAG: hypothetical protein JSS53_10240, partial [Proteobacteria bacterium]|nr:hypothetical protein [Pseudomonadota bacterium]